ncbi:F-BAR domain only protein 2 isoform X8 [Bradysia coprophila]|uniref:F-BAR domain only protein 2 isoform X8 n=1 Tax=Bradysia coprophila TaxID=38358 RepID=UPI00187D7347|nr:F-BAR domain only protein 2 isoform X8 [Bradysia coprophila]XP_037040940.1 F-BAR domain only protein 2 isoform X8 [Bradysia coprophila]XP_037040941.1 F-BAR domain only protein 2 isoform X8 [Bradysia coprophila]
MTVDFNDYFWGDKNNGFDVLYHNMKYGLVASKELSDFFREKSNIEEHNSKLMTKLANKAGSGCVNGTFAPIWVVLKSSADRLASLHLQMVQKISELVKDVAKYADELHKKHKTVKEEESSTLEVVQAMQSSTVAVQKSKDLYNSKMLEFEKLKKDNASTKDLEKAETKLKKQQDDYKALLEKHNPVKMEFERRMNITCKKFQDIEDSHLKQMKEFLSTYIELLQNNHDMVGQVHSEFKRQFLEMTVDKLLEQFVLSKYTGLEKPEIVELDLANWSSATNLNATTTTQSNNTTQPHQSANITLNSSDLPGSPATTNSTTTKREPYLRNWFLTSSSSSSSSAATAQQQQHLTPVPTTTTPIPIVSLSSANDTKSDSVDVTPNQSPQQSVHPSVPISAILRSGRNKAKVKKANKKKKDGVETSSTKDEKTSVAEEVTEENKVEETPVVSLKSSTPLAPTATPDVDEDGYSIQPKEPQWETVASKKEIFYSDSDSDSEHDEQERKIRVEIKPLNNGIAPISASVDELRATVESLSLSPLGGALSQHQSPGASNASTPTASHPYAPLQSPTLSVSNTSRYADLGDIFSEVGEISASAPASANLSKSGRQIPTPTSANSIAIPRPPSRREAAVRGRVSPSTISRADSVGSLEFRTASIGIGSSRGPSPLTIGMSDTVPLAVAFHEIVHAYFKGSDESRCQVKMSGDMMLSFPAGIVSVLANNPNPAKLGFRIKNTQNLENVLPNKQLVTIDQLQSTSLSTVLEFNMPALTSLLRRQSEQNPTASYFNVDILKYQVKSKSGALSCPFQLVCYWKCEPTHTDIKIDYKYNSHAMAAPSPLLNVSISVPVDGGVKNVQSKPFSAWLGESNRLVWNFTDISQHSDNNGVGTLRARLDVANGPSNPSMLTTQFNCEGTTLSGIEFELVGAGYRLSLVKRRFVSGKYICEGDGIRNMTTPTPPSSSSPSPYNRTG